MRVFRAAKEATRVFREKVGPVYASGIGQRYLDRLIHEAEVNAAAKADVGAAMKVSQSIRDVSDKCVVDEFRALALVKEDAENKRTYAKERFRRFFVPSNVTVSYVGGITALLTFSAGPELFPYTLCIFGGPLFILSMSFQYLDRYDKYVEAYAKCLSVKRIEDISRSRSASPVSSFVSDSFVGPANPEGMKKTTRQSY